MKLREWIWDTDDEEETENDEADDDPGQEDSPLVNPDDYTDREILEDKTRLQDQRRQAERELDEHRSKYEKLIEKGQQDSLSEERRQELAHRANMLKKKYKAVKQKYNDIRTELALVVSVEAAREVMSVADRSRGTTIGELIDQGELQTEEVEHAMEEVRIKHGLKQKDMQKAISALDVDMMPKGTEMEETEEIKMMREGSKDDIDGEELLEDDAGTSEELGIDDEFDSNIDSDGLR